MSYTMDNRRRDYRHSFTPTRRLAVRLTVPDQSVSIAGEIIDLSVGGMCVQASALKDVNADHFIAICAFVPGAQPLAIPMERVHQPSANQPRAGFHFLPMSDTVAEDERERVIWKLLLEEQRIQRRQRFAS